MSNIYLKVTIETFSKLRFSGFKKFVTRPVFGEPQLTQPESLSTKTPVQMFFCDFHEISENTMGILLLIRQVVTQKYI